MARETAGNLFSPSFMDNGTLIWCTNATIRIWTVASGLTLLQPQKSPLHRSAVCTNNRLPHHRKNSQSVAYFMLALAVDPLPVRNCSKSPLSANTVEKLARLSPSAESPEFLPSKACFCKQGLENGLRRKRCSKFQSQFSRDGDFQQYPPLPDVYDSVERCDDSFTRPAVCCNR